MPSSWLKYAVDFNNNGKIDLLNEPEDAIGSVANFLAEHGWQPNQITHLELDVAQKAHTEPFLADGIQPQKPLKHLLTSGISAHGPHSLKFLEKPAALIDLPDYKGPTIWWAGFNNFYVVTRYNRSNFYAAAVISLAEKLQKQK